MLVAGNFGICYKRASIIQYCWLIFIFIPTLIRRQSSFQFFAVFLFLNNNREKTNCKRELIIPALADKTKISEGPVDYEVQAGSPATFRCSAQQDNDLVLTVDWLRNGEFINFEAEPRFVKMPDSSLTITKTTELDSGEYTCMASTILDNVVAKATLIVQDIPNAPQLNKNVECKAAVATLGWTPMGDNRAPILNYIVQYNTSFTPDSWDVALPSVSASDSRCTVSWSEI